MEDAVMAVLRGGDTGAVAAQRGIAEDALKRWTQAFLDAGRAALKGL
jgi:transposase-like protein